MSFEKLNKPRSESLRTIVLAGTLAAMGGLGLVACGDGDATLDSTPKVAETGSGNNVLHEYREGGTRRTKSAAVMVLPKLLHTVMALISWSMSTVIGTLATA